MTFADRCKLFGVYFAALGLWGKQVALSDALAILRYSRIGPVSLKGGVWKP